MGTSCIPLTACTPIRTSDENENNKQKLSKTQTVTDFFQSTGEKIESTATAARKGRWNPFVRHLDNREIKKMDDEVKEMTQVNWASETKVIEVNKSTQSENKAKESEKDIQF